MGEPVVPSTFDAFEEHLEHLPEDGTMAIVSDPWAGREWLLDHAETALEGQTRTFSPFDFGHIIATDLEEVADEPLGETTGGSGDRADVSEADAILVGDCERLFQRRIGGFDQVVALQHELARTDRTVVTSWNQYAWSYLTSVTTLADSFDAVFEVPRLDVEGAETLLRERYDVEAPERALETYAEQADTEEPQTELLLESEGRLQTMRGRVQVLWERLQRLYRTSTVESHLERLVKDAHGNPRTICRLFDHRTNEGRDGRPDKPDVEYEESYLLWLLLTNEQLTVEELVELLEPGVGPSTQGAIETTIRKLTRQDIVSLDDENVSIRPEAFGLVVSHLQKRRLLW